MEELLQLIWEKQPGIMIVVILIMQLATLRIGFAIGRFYAEEDRQVNFIITEEN